MLHNKADTIEEYILQELSKQRDRQIELKRTELADIISCAPSQISYVLNTRFTQERGFYVESRRGLGGYIKIVIMDDGLDAKQELFRELIEKIDEDADFALIKSMTDYLFQNRLLTRREAELIVQTARGLFKARAADKLQSEECIKLLRSIFQTVAKMS